MSLSIWIVTSARGFVKKNHPIFQKVAQKVSKQKKYQNIGNKVQIESPKCLHQTMFETSKYLHWTIFQCAFLGKNIIDLLKQKIAQNATITLGYFVFSKNIMSLQK